MTDKPLLTGSRRLPAVESAVAAGAKRSRPTDGERWGRIVEAVNQLMMILADKPQELRLDYQVCPGGILNAYREGDLTFDEAVLALEKWNRTHSGARSEG